MNYDLTPVGTLEFEIGTTDTEHSVEVLQVLVILDILE